MAAFSSGASPESEKGADCRDTRRCQPTEECAPLRVACGIEVAEQKVEVEDVGAAVAVEVGSGNEARIALALVKGLNEEVEIEHIRRVVVVGVAREEGEVCTGDIAVGEIGTPVFRQPLCAFYVDGVVLSRHMRQAVGSCGAEGRRPGEGRIAIRGAEREGDRLHGVLAVLQRHRARQGRDRRTEVYIDRSGGTVGGAVVGLVGEAIRTGITGSGRVGQVRRCAGQRPFVGLVSTL
jgi:hypothetical protein